MGYASRIENNATEKPEFYLPHHGVYKKTLKKRKLRVAFDPPALFKGKCLNDVLTMGPVLINDLPNIWIKFREGAVTITADIEAMFSRVKMRAVDLRLHGFLRKDTGSKEMKSHIPIEPLEKINFHLL